MDTRIPQRWAAGEPVSAKKLNESLDVLQALTHGPRETPDGGSPIRWVRMKEWIGPAEDFIDREAVVQRWDEEEDEWTDTDPEQVVKVSDLTGKLCYHEDAIVPVYPHRSGKLVPLSGNATTLIGETTGSVSANIPTTTYKIHFGPLGSEVAVDALAVPPALSRIVLDLGTKIKITQIYGDGWIMEPLDCGPTP